MSVLPMQGTAGVISRAAGRLPSCQRRLNWTGASLSSEAHAGPLTWSLLRTASTTRLWQVRCVAVHVGRREGGGAYDGLYAKALASFSRNVWTETLLSTCFSA